MDDAEAEIGDVHAIPQGSALLFNGVSYPNSHLMMRRLHFFLLIIILQGCVQVQYVINAPHAVESYQKGELAVSGSIMLPSAPVGVQAQGQVQYSLIKGLVLLANGYAMAGQDVSLIFGYYSAGFSRAAGFDGGIGYQTKLNDGFGLCLLGGYGGQNVKSQGGYMFGSGEAYMFHGVWLQPLLRIKVPDNLTGATFDLGLNYRRTYGRRTQRDPESKEDFWPGNTWYNLFNPLLGISIHKGNKQVFVRSVVSFGGTTWGPTGPGSLSKRFYDSKLGLEAGMAFVLR